tara:strand:+ start:276 stop:491 length:216 start_codon:yes stop_codon:yes gene_type:complete
MAYKQKGYVPFTKMNDGENLKDDSKSTTPSDADKAMMKKLMTRFKNATDPAEKQKIKIQMENLAKIGPKGV